jgi:hypothetical protein
MRKLLIPLVACAALALPAAASAHDAWWHHRFPGVFARVSGTGTSFAGTSATASGSIVAGKPVASGTFSATLNTTWSQATTRTGEHGTLSCAPASLVLTLTDSASPANHTTATLTGRTCTFTKSDGTTFRGFVGRGSIVGAGTLANVSGVEHVFLMQRADGSVHGMVFGGFPELPGRFFAALAHDRGDCDGHH